MEDKSFLFRTFMQVSGTWNSQRLLLSVKTEAKAALDALVLSMFAS